MSAARTLSRIAIALLAAVLAGSAVFQTAQTAAMFSPAAPATTSVAAADEPCCNECGPEHLVGALCAPGCVGVSAIVSAAQFSAVSARAEPYPVEPPSFAEFLPGLDPDPPRAILPG